MKSIFYAADGSIVVTKEDDSVTVIPKGLGPAAKAAALNALIAGDPSPPDKPRKLAILLALLVQGNVLIAQQAQTIAQADD